MSHSSSLLRTILYPSILLAGLQAHTALAQDDLIPAHPMMSDTWFIGGGALWADSNVTGSLNRGRLAGAIIDFEDDPTDPSMPNSACRAGLLPELFRTAVDSR